MSGKIDRKELRTFGLSLSVVALIWCLILWWRGHTGAIPWLLGAAPVLALLALVAPIVLWPIHKVWMPIAHGIAKALTWLLLSMAFYLIFTPYGVIMKLIRKDPLDRRIEKDRDSYWHRRDDGPFDPNRLRKQY